jgi:hypothetical protein
VEPQALHILRILDDEHSCKRKTASAHNLVEGEMRSRSEDRDFHALAKTGHIFHGPKKR